MAENLIYKRYQNAEKGKKYLTQIIKTSGLKPFSGIRKHINLCNKSVFFFLHYSLANSITN